MKKVLISLVLTIVMSTLIGCGGKATPDSVYLWKPEAKEDRYLKAEYVTDLIGVVKVLGEYGHTVQQKGVGFTTHYNCQISDCSNAENAEHWMFAVIQQKTVNSEKYKTYEDRMNYIVNKKLMDILFALKQSFLVEHSGKIEGVVIGMIWSEKRLIKDMIKKPKFENVDVYIDIETFQAYQKRSISYDALLEKAVFINASGDESVQVNYPKLEEEK